MASRLDFANYLQRLDAEKYTRLIDRRATEAIQEFLVEKGVDDSEFVNAVSVHQYNNTQISGNAYGPIATGSGATATMSGVTVSASAITKKGSGK
ncbi:hypothetical protein ACIA5D_17355 [Actinoplanes sp. NPDC051513]|uniref:hypothetical protein n=1 Tax=Actinoplanes sp. NPDC051513 TaxID=3363908 RepID=UPI0037BC650E